MNTSRSTRITTRNRLFPHLETIADDQWNNWRWQWDNRLTTLDELANVLSLSDSEIGFWKGSTQSRLPFAVTPYFASLFDSSDPNDPLRRCVIPDEAEYTRRTGELADPLAEQRHSPVPHLVHRYPDRALLLMENECPSYCRYCTRGRLVGRSRSKQTGPDRLRQAVDYVAAHEEIHDVLLSGGEPFLWADAELDALLRQLEAIDHLDLIRIGTKAPVTLPQCITPERCAVLERCTTPIYVSLHATHANELTEDSRAALHRLANAGCVLLSQTVLLRGVNDSVEALTDLFRGLLRCRVRPYYLLLCDPVVGSSRFWVSVDDAKELVNRLRSTLSGLAIPHLIMDLPDGGGKIPISPEYQSGEDDVFYHYRDCHGNDGYHYPKR